MTKKNTAKYILIIGIILNLIGWYIFYNDYMSCNQAPDSYTKELCLHSIEKYSLFSISFQNIMINIGFILMFISVILFIINKKNKN